ncbi:MAG: sulfotransferase [Acidimicrobiales bacterium]
MRPSDRQPPSVERPTVVLVLASARSGTTLLGTLLDLHPKARFVGELNRRRGWLERNGSCGCGVRYAECRFWAGLAGRPSFGTDQAGRGVPAGDRRATAAEIRELQAAVRRPVAAVRAVARRPTAGQRRYVAYLEQLYRDIAAAADAPVIVDTSKQNLVDIVLLSSIGALPVRVVHLHRDPRGVVASRLRGARRRLEVRDVEHPLATRLGGPIVVRDTLAWDRVNGTALVLGRWLGVPAVRLPYEDLVADSHGSVRDLVAELGLDPDELADAWVRPDLVDLPTNHSMGGNRVRRSRGPTPVVADTRWSDDLHPALRWAVEVLTAPVRVGLSRT